MSPLVCYHGNATIAIPPWRCENSEGNQLQRWEAVYAASAGSLSNTSRFSCLYMHHGDPAGGSAGSLAECTLDNEAKGGHPSMAGTYLAACVLFAKIHGVSPAGLSWAPHWPRPDGTGVPMSEEDRTFLQGIAERVVLG